jgi:hypothetical protein
MYIKDSDRFIVSSKYPTRQQESSKLVLNVAIFWTILYKTDNANLKSKL